MLSRSGRASYTLDRNEKLIFSIGEVDLDVVPLVGDKVLSVAQLEKSEVPVPPGFTISTRLYDRFVEETGISSYIKKEFDLLKVKKDDGRMIRKFSRKIRDRILDAKFPEELEYDILKSYQRLSGFTEVWVAVRSSIMTDISKHADFTGQLYTELNVKGKDDLLKAIKQCFASIYELHAVEYALSHDLNPIKLQPAVLVQKMIQAEVSGVMFTIDPVTNNPNLLSIEAVYGLGDMINSGDLSPDQYTVDKITNQIRDRRIVPQEWMHVLKANAKTVESSKN